MKSTIATLTLAIIAFVSLSACSAANPPSPSADLLPTAAPLATAYPGPYQLPLSDEFDLPAEFEYTRAAPELHEVISDTNLDIDDEPLHLSYYLYLPDVYYDNAVTEPLPLLLRLHGASGLTSDDIGTFDPPQMGIPLRTNQEDFPFIVVFPIIPPGRGWQTLTPTLNQLLDELISRYPVDEDRIFLAGFSAGGAGAYALSTEVPERFAAVAVVAGYWPFPAQLDVPAADHRLCALSQTDFWAFHSEIDFVVPVAESDNITAYLVEACDLEVEIRYTRYTDYDHVQTAIFSYNSPELFEWFIEVSE